jgi:hypothetical protein
MDLPFDKTKKENKRNQYIEFSNKNLKKETPSVFNMCKKLKQSMIKECFIDLFKEEPDIDLDIPIKLSPYLKAISVGDVTLSDNSESLINIPNFKEKLRETLDIMGLLSDKENESLFSVNVNIMHCINIDLNLENEDFNHLIRTNLMIKYTTIRKFDNKVYCELWYQGKGEKRVIEVNDNIKSETIEIAYEDNLNYILNMLKTNSF